MEQTNDRITSAVLEALTRILDYIEPDEQRDYGAMPEGGRADHIFGDICFMRGWLESAKRHVPRPVLGSRRKSPGEVGGPYGYHRDKEGCDCLFLISGPDGFSLGVPFWDGEADAEKVAKRVVEALNYYEAATRK
jgi:hypothetical protein